MAKNSKDVKQYLFFFTYTNYISISDKSTTRDVKQWVMIMNHLHLHNTFFYCKIIPIHYNPHVDT